MNSVLQRRRNSRYKLGVQSHRRTASAATDSSQASHRVVARMTWHHGCVVLDQRRHAIPMSESSRTANWRRSFRCAPQATLPNTSASAACRRKQIACVRSASSKLARHPRRASQQFGWKFVKNSPQGQPTLDRPLPRWRCEHHPNKPAKLHGDAAKEEIATGSPGQVTDFPV